jgi:hypothetical protein
MSNPHSRSSLDPSKAVFLLILAHLVGFLALLGGVIALDFEASYIVLVPLNSATEYRWFPYVLDPQLRYLFWLAVFFSSAGLTYALSVTLDRLRQKPSARYQTLINLPFPKLAYTLLIFFLSGTVTFAAYWNLYDVYSPVFRLRYVVPLYLGIIAFYTYLIHTNSFDRFRQIHSCVLGLAYGLSFFIAYAALSSSSSGTFFPTLSLLSHGLKVWLILSLVLVIRLLVGPLNISLAPNSPILLFLASPRRKIVSGHISLFTTLVGYFGIGYLLVDSTYPFLSSGSLIEQLIEYTAGFNFAHFGFLATGFISDYSPSLNPSAHPYLYTHQPNAPSILIGALLNFSSSLLTVRMAFVFFSLIGLYLYYRFILAVTNNRGIALVSLAVVAFNYEQQILWADHFVFAFYHIGIFGSLLFYLKGVRQPKSTHSFLFSSCIAIAALTNTMSIVVVIVGLIGLHFLFFRKAKTSTTLLILAFVVTSVSASLVIVRNILGLGFNVALKDLLYTLTNRIVGVPSRVEMSEFYDSHNIVLWGVDTVQSTALWSWFFDSIIQPTYYFLIPIILLIFSTKGRKPFLGQHSFKSLGILGFIGIAMYSWHFVFFAQGAIYPAPFLAKNFEMMLVPAVLILGVSSFETTLRHHSGSIRDVNRVFSIRIALALILGIALSLPFQGLRSAYKGYKGQFQSQPLATITSILELEPGPVWTNIDSSILYFFSPNSVIAGGCSQSALLNLDITGCQSTFTLNKSQARPRYVFLSAMWRPGYDTCREECFNKSIRHFEENWTKIFSYTDSSGLVDMRSNSMMSPEKLKDFGLKDSPTRGSRWEPDEYWAIYERTDDR